jgi:hypothetical protein
MEYFFSVSAYMLVWSMFAFIVYAITSGVIEYINHK